MCTVQRQESSLPLLATHSLALVGSHCNYMPGCIRWLAWHCSQHGHPHQLGNDSPARLRGPAAVQCSKAFRNPPNAPGAHHSDALQDVDPQDDGVLLVEHRGGQDLQHAGEDCVQLVGLPLVLLALRSTAWVRAGLCKEGSCCGHVQLKVPAQGKLPCPHSSLGRERALREQTTCILARRQQALQSMARRCCAAGCNIDGA